MPKEHNHKTTAEVCRELGVNRVTATGWVRSGKINVEVIGEGTQRRILWTDDAVDQARRIRDRVAGDSSLATSLGPEIASAVELARRAQRLQSDTDVIVATPDSARVFRSDATLSDVLRRVRGRILVILG